MSAVPQLRGLLASSTKNNLYGMTIFVTATTLCFKHFVYDARKKKYEEFYKYVSETCLALLPLHCINIILKFSDFKVMSSFYLCYIYKILSMFLLSCNYYLIVSWCHTALMLIMLGGHESEKSGVNSLNLENLGNFQGILCNLGDNLYQAK